MTMRIRMIITALMLMVSMGMDAQIRVEYQTDSAKIAAYREAIGLDLSVPDFSTKKIDAKVMGTRLAGILEFLLETYTQETYERLLTRMLGEQVDEYEQKYLEKMGGTVERLGQIEPSLFQAIKACLKKARLLKRKYRKLL